VPGTKEVVMSYLMLLLTIALSTGGNQKMDIYDCEYVLPDKDLINCQVSFYGGANGRTKPSPQVAAKLVRSCMEGVKTLTGNGYVMGTAWWIIKSQDVEDQIPLCTGGVSGHLVWEKGKERCL